MITTKLLTLNYISIHEEIDVPHCLTVPIIIHKMAHTATSTGKKTKPFRFRLAFFVVSTLVTAAILLLLMFLAFTFALLKLENLSRVRLTNALSVAADAGVVGIVSRKNHKAEAN